VRLPSGSTGSRKWGQKLVSTGRFPPANRLLAAYFRLETSF
jgi:hypothetical protein